MSNAFSGPYDIILQAGQSNAEGCGLGPALEEYVPSEQVLYLTNDLSISVGAERLIADNSWSDFSLFFAREYVRSGRLAEGRRVLILRAAVGGTGFLDKHWGPQDDLFQKMLEMIRHAKTLHEDSRFVAFLWHQGETDAILNASYDGHYENLARLLDETRAEIGEEGLPFVAGDFVQHWKMQNLSICEPVVAAIRAVCRDKNGAFIETEGLLSNNQTVGNDDPIHFSKVSLEALGKAYFNAIFPG